jgi:bacillithiol biosynthesis cysteine-adding enzyme BshC
MEICTIPFDQIPQFSSKDIAYATGNKALRPFFKYPVRLDAFEQVMEDKGRDDTDRATLVDALENQYSGLETSEAVKKNIQALRQPTTFTVTTAHQPSLFTGPLYYIYKIISTINLAEQLNARYPDRHVVPVFINGGEDHDFAEVNHAHIFGKTVTWENDESGPVGQMHTASLQSVLAELQEILGDSEHASRIYDIIHRAYTGHERYGDATNQLVNELFREYGLVVINMSHPTLKRLFIPIMREELLEQPSRAFVEATTAQLEAAGFSGQAYAREINLFYLGERLDMRKRFEADGDRYRVVDTDIVFSKEELLAELEAHPERFSPNVVMRPLYQELVLPNLAYIGGGGELAYWLERKTQFEHFGINYPMLVRRNSALLIDKGSSKRMAKLELGLEDLFEDVEVLVKRYVRQNTENEISLSDQKKELQRIFDDIIEKAQEIDKTLVKSTKSEQAKVMNSLDTLEGKLLRAEKQRHDIAINQIRSLKDKLFPGNGLQERYDNFLTFYLRYGDDFLPMLKEHLDPMKPGMVVWWDK